MDKEKTSIQVKIFHTVGIVLNQSGILKLDSLTGRIWLVSFWFFCIIMGSVYRANLVAFFAYTKPAEEFTSLEDMIDSDYRIGCVGGSTFLKNSEASLLCTA
ncbi:hypothetical protein SNE40_005104 [Patella caerulea]|uniref:Ionotropic glutamate receptor C-terminal domain-containing protein n=1 Tax=Patella caerulea TaxID=87958 RepID=A0AAN8K4H6_PATCE